MNTYKKNKSYLKDSMLKESQPKGKMNAMPSELSKITTIQNAVTL